MKLVLEIYERVIGPLRELDIAEDSSSGVWPYFCCLNASQDGYYSERGERPLGQYGK